MTLLGQFALWAAFLIALWCVVIAFSGRWQGRPELAATVTRSVYVIFGCLVVASLALWKGLITHDFNIEYVAAYTSRNLPPYYIVSAFWAGQKGSLLFWAVVLSLFASLAQLLTPRRNADLMPYVAGVTSAVAAFFVSVMLFGASPFERLRIYAGGRPGLNPQLQNVGMVIHPPMLYLGYISITIPFAFAIAALLSRRLDTGWIHAIRKWTLVSWLFLSIGITLGMWWAYVELGWGGYWAWDPVENASFLPWLTMTAFLHSVMIQEKRGMLKRWNLGLIVGTFLLSIFGTFITRSGVIASVHSFTQSNVGYFFLAFLVVAAVLSFTLLYTRWPLLEADVQLESMLSREAAFLFNNLLLVGIAFSVLWGTLFPDPLRGGAGQQDHGRAALLQSGQRAARPPAARAHGIGPLIAWRKASAANLRRQFVTPLTAGGATLVALLAAGVRDLYPVMALALAGFVAGTVAAGVLPRRPGPPPDARGIRAGGVPPAHRAEPPAVWRLHRPCRAADLLRGVRRDGVQGGAGGDAQARRVGRAAEPVRPHLHASPMWASRSTRRSTAWSARRRCRWRWTASRPGCSPAEKRQHVDSFKRPTFEPSTEVGIRSGLREDLYLVFAGAVGGTEEAVYRFNINPLVWWVWFGGFVLAFGGIVTMWPGGGPTIARARPAQGGYGVALVGAGKEAER